MAKRSAVAAKAAASRAKTYPDANDAMMVKRCGCAAGKPPPQEVLDEIAEREITGGWNTDRDNQCQSCFVALSASGKCPLCGEKG